MNQTVAKKKNNLEINITILYSIVIEMMMNCLYSKLTNSIVKEKKHMQTSKLEYKLW